MKKLLPILLLASLLLSACSVDWTGEKNKKIAELEKQTQNDAFSKKQECLWYKDKILKEYEKETLAAKELWQEYTVNLEEIFYSKKNNSCFAVLNIDWMRSGDLKELKIIQDILSSKTETYNKADSIWIFLEKIKELKWE